MADLTNKTLIYLKGFLFLVILALSAGLLLYNNPDIRTAGLLLILIWASARLYYFMFYVIEKYVDTNYKFSGIYSFIRYLLTTTEKHPESK